MERQGVSASPARGSKWGRRASVDPFARAADDDGDAVKENTAPSPARRPSHAIVMTPTMVRRRSAGAAVAVVNVISKQNSAASGGVTSVRATALTATLLGKRARGPSPTRPAVANVSAKKLKIAASDENDDEEEDGDEDAPETQRTLFADDAELLDDDGKPRNLLVVNDFDRVAELAFGAVQVGQRKSLLLTLQNPSQVGNARVRYEGYVMASATREPLPKQTMDSRFKCDMHVCTVHAEGKVTLRITFEPKEQDVNQDLVAMLRFTVNDRFRLQCEVSGSGVPSVAKPISLRERMAVAQGAIKSRKSLDNSSRESDASVVAPPTPSKEDRVTAYPIESVMASGVKRRESVALVVSPPRHRKTKKMRVEDNDRANGHADIVTGASAATGGFQGSWWEKRKTLSDEEWMQRQEEGFTKWMNFVLVDSMGEENEIENTAVIIEHPHRATPRGRKRRSRIDFSSLRVLAMKRMESMWSRAAMEIYRSDAVTEAAGNLKNEIAEGKLVVRRDRPAYADVGLQEELVELLNNYHPVWLCLALETVLGHRIMAQEKCSLRSVMTYCANLAEKNATSKRGGESSKPPRMPRHLRRVVLQHIVHDQQVAKRHRLVKNLKTPVEGGTLRAGKANPKISGRDYFDALMDSFAYKFLMIVLLLDRAAAHRSDTFARFPCLFRVQPAKSKRATAEDDTKHVKNSQGIVTEFCRLFLSKEGRIDKHLKQLGYSVTFHQVPLDEVDLEITNLAVDLRDGVRLAKLLETLTATPGVSNQPLSSFLRVPALSRLQKVHNVEICLHFLQEKCGRDFLESIRTNSGQVKATGRLSFATLRDKEDAKLVETMAKAVVDGHRERTLALLWKLISVFQLRSLVNVDKLSKEIENIKQRMSFRSMEFYESLDTKLSVSVPPTTESSQSLDEDVRELLLEWCRVVCANYFVRVVDFTDSFADGRALCYLLHYYHPMLLAKSEIRITTAEYASSSTRAIHSASDITFALENERRHFTLVNDRVKQLGEVPVLLPEQYDSTNPPDEKVIVTYVCYLQSRLMDSSREIHAAARLKRWWRSPRIRLLMRRKKNRAARIIQRFWYTSSVKRLAIRRCRRLLKAGRMVASYMCAWFDRSRFIKLRRAVVALQRAFRRRMLGSTTNIGKLVAAVKFQRAWRRHSLRQSVRLSMCKREVCRRIVRQMSASRIKRLLQVNVEQKREQREALRVYQEMLDKQRFESGKKALQKRVHARCARVIQSAARMFIAYRRQCVAATRIQSSWRRFMSRVRYLHKLKSAIVLQVAVRRWIKRRKEEAMARFKAMLSEQKRERKTKVLRAKVERRCASRIQQSWRACKVKKQHKAAVKVQSMYRVVRAKKVLTSMKVERDHSAAVVIQKHARRVVTKRHFVEVRKGVIRLQAAARGVALRTNVLDFSRFRRNAMRMRSKMAKWKLQEWASQLAQARMIRRAAATTVQKTWRMFITLRRFRLAVRSAVKIQALVKGVQSRRYQFNYFVFTAKMQRMRSLLAAWTIASWSKRQLARYHQHRGDAATVIQSYVRMQLTRKQFLLQKHCAVKIQSHVRGMISRERNLNFCVFKFRAMVSKRRIAMWRIRSWMVRCMQQHRRSQAATTIQKNMRMLTKRSEFAAARTAAIKIQARFRGKLHREFVFDYASFKTVRVRCVKKMAMWKLQEWIMRIVRTHRTKRLEAVRLISKSWSAFKLRMAITTRVEWTFTRKLAVSRIQQWWRNAKLQRAAQHQLHVLRIQRAKHLERERAIRATIRIQDAWRHKVSHTRAKRSRQGLIKMREFFAAVCISNSVFRHLVRDSRGKLGHARALCRIQSWWRGMLVRLHEKREAVTAQRKKLATMTLVAPAQASAIRVPTDAQVHEQSQPLTLGTRLEMALHMLLHGKRLQDMLFASHTIEMCTRYSRECAWKCVQLKIYNTIFAAIRGLNRSRPHVELLHQLLLVLVNLTSYQRKESKNYAAPNTAQGGDQSHVDQDDLRAVDALIDLIHVHRDMHVIFVLASRILKHYLLVLKPHTSSSKEVFDQWSEAHRRLLALHELLHKKMQVAAWTARIPATPSKTAANASTPNASNPNANVLAKINPKTAVSIAAQLLKVIE